MSGSVRALLEKLGSLVPGYAGYADRETRRECDQVLRLAVSSRLGAARAALDRKHVPLEVGGELDGHTVGHRMPTVLKLIDVS